jgi:outer membrane murein-binding lipoprotein Lpp
MLMSVDLKILEEIVEKAVKRALEEARSEDLRMIAEAIKALADYVREGFKQVDKRLSTLESDVGLLKSDVSALKTDVSTLKSDVSTLKSDVSALKSDVSTLKSDVSALKASVSRIDRRLSRVERTLENITISIEEEARIVVEGFLREKGLEISLGSIALDKRYEFDIYGSHNGIVIVGEAKTRASEKLIDRLVKRVERARKKWPDKFTGKVIIVLYCLKYIGDPKKAEEKGVWLIESTRELVKRPSL